MLHALEVRGTQARSIVTADALWLRALGLGRHTKLITPPKAEKKQHDYLKTLACIKGQLRT